jgi:lipopolysaccharide/colanic/teichoic acid biosynthesis glycosyltransferase
MNAYPVSRYATSRTKFLWEWLLALFFSVMSLPVLAACMLSVLCDDGPPIFFRQTRVGKNGRPFRILKIRTMRAAAGPAITSEHDVRITWSGGLLRRTKLDELPQLWNVLKGDMGLAGPRPEVPQFVAPQSPEWLAVLRVRPGLTGAASLHYRNEAALLAEAADPIACYQETLLPAKLALELYYLQTCSFFGDLRLLWKTGTSLLSIK